MRKIVACLNFRWWWARRDAGQGVRIEMVPGWGESRFRVVARAKWEEFEK